MKSVIFLKLTTRSRFYLFIAAFCLTVILCGGLRAQSGIVYVYDELGRVIAVTDPSGDTVRYNYDAVGNVTSISRAASSTLSFISFSPGSGPVGATVTIYGTAFSTTPANNTVTFNGTAATVSASTATKITTTVPSGATTGVIQVTVSGNSVSSSTSFTVTSSTTPTISAISPTIGTSGTSLTITGTNFETTAVKNKTKINITNTGVSSATATSISTSVPVTGSGKVSVTTPNGTAVSSDDFFIPPAGFATSDVAVTGRMTSGNSQTVTLSTAGKVGMILFDANAGQRASIKVTSCSITSAFLNVYQPNGLLFTLGSAGSTLGFVTTSQFNASGTYAIFVDPLGSNTGAITFTLYVFNDSTGTITPGGSSVSVSTTTPGQMALLSFSATANQRVSVKITSGSWTGGGPSAADVSIRKPDGTTLATVFTQTTGFLDTQTLPVTGTYTLITDPANLSTGGTTLTLYDVGADISGTITAGGSSVTVSPNIPGLNALHTFSGTASQRIALKLTSGSWSGGAPSAADIYIKKPDGTTLASQFVIASGFIDVQTLPTTGTYTVFTDPSGASTGTLTLTLYDVPADATGSMTFGTGFVTGNTVPGQNSWGSFSGTSGQRVSILVSGGSFSGGVSGSSSTFYFRTSGGSTLGSVFVTGSGFIDSVSLGSTGTFHVISDLNNSTVGSATVTAYNVVDSSGTVTINGGATSVSTSTPGQDGDYTFSGTASQQVTVSITSNTTSCVAITLKKPDGSTLTSTSSCAGSFNLAQQTLPTTGTYTIHVNPSGSNTGSLNLTVTSP
jgi:YD repeat-containing protein